MAIAGPRLDRPSAIGDEGRPRTTSLWIASVVVIVLITLVGTMIGQPDLILTLGGTVGFTIAGIGLINRDRFAFVFIGYIVFLVFGALLTFSQLFLLLRGGLSGLGVIGLTLAMLGLGFSWADVELADGTKHVLVGTSVSYLTLLSSLFVLSVVASTLLLGWSILEMTTTGQSPLASSAWFLLTVGYTAGALRFAQWQLPIEQLVPADRRPALEERLHTVGRITLTTALTSAVALFLLLVGWVGGLLGPHLTTGSGIAVALDALATKSVIGLLAGVGTLSLLAVVVAVLLRAATRRLEGTTLRVVAAVAAGVCLSVLPIVSVPFDPLGTVRIVIAVLVAPIGLVVIAGGGLAAVSLDLIPDRSGGAAVAAAGLVLAAIGFGGGSVATGWDSSLIVFACVASAVIVWDLSWFGLGLTAELGHIPETRRLELFHGVVVVGVGLVSVAILTALDILRTAVFADGGNPVALLVAGIGVFLLLLPLRG